MNTKEIYESLKEQFKDKILGYNEVPVDCFITIDKTSLPEIAKFLRDNPKLYLDNLMCLSGMDYPATAGQVPEHFTVVYHLFSTKHLHKITLKADAPKDNPLVPSVYNIWPIAREYEREAYDLFGIKFGGHPNLTRILLPDDWEGHPLQKDYQFPKSYHGIPC